MKNLLLIIGLFYNLFAYSQNTQKGITNTYYINSINNSKEVCNIDMPLNLSAYNPYWTSRVKVIGYKTDPMDLVKEYIIPGIMDINIDDNMNVFLLRLYFDLRGNLQYLEFSYASNLDIPLVAIERLEIAMKDKCKLILNYDPDKVDDIPYIMISPVFLLRILQKEFKNETPKDRYPVIEELPIIVPIERH